MPMIIGDGYVPFHIRVHAKAETAKEFAQFTAAARRVKAELETAGRAERFPHALIDRLWRIPGAAHVAPYGGYSAVLGALKLAGPATGRPRAMYGVAGSGPVAEGIRRDLAASGIEFRETARRGADSSVEITMMDTSFRFMDEFQIHFMSVRERSHALALDAAERDAAEAFMFSRPNRGRAALAGQLFAAGRLVSMRVHGFSRFVRPADYLDILPNVQLVFVWAGEIRQLVGGLGVALPQGSRPAGMGAGLERAAERIGTHGGRRRLVAFVIGRTAYLFAPELGLAAFEVPEGERLPISDTRLHGALLARGLELPGYVPSTADELAALGNHALQASYCEYDRAPEGGPGIGFAPAGSWQIGGAGLGDSARK